MRLLCTNDAWPQARGGSLAQFEGGRALRHDALPERDVVTVGILDAELAEAVRRVVDRVVDARPPE
jgi:hypothetical protein